MIDIQDPDVKSFLKKHAVSGRLLLANMVSTIHLTTALKDDFNDTKLNAISQEASNIFFCHLIDALGCTHKEQRALIADYNTLMSKLNMRVRNSLN